MLRFVRCALLATCFLIVRTRSVVADGADSWNISRFSSDGATVNKAASTASPKPGTDVVVFEEEDSYVFDVDGKTVHTHYLAYKVLTQKGTEGWDAISLSWEPWHEERPTIQARVITPDNVIHALEAKTITDAPAGDQNEKTYGNGRVLRAPLPAIAPGSVVEEEEVIRESALFFGAGVAERHFFGGSVPIQETKLVLDAPESLPIHYSVELLPDVKPEKRSANGRVQIVFQQGPVEALEDVDNYLPSEMAGRPNITFSTGVSWQNIAQEYGKTISEKASPKDVQAIVHTVTSGKTTREEKAAAILQYLSREIRYTGVEFGEAAIIPHSPGETLQHKYGDCKDKATLAVAMLQAAGIPSYVALLNVGWRRDVEAELPGMGLFDHAIVYVPGNPELWIDPTDQYARLGQLPRADQGRLALIARAETTKLVKIPEASSQDNKILEKREFYMAENGAARVIETTEPRGAFESEYRSVYADADNKDSQKNLKDYVKNQYLAEKLVRIERSNPADLSKYFQLVIEAGEAKRGFTDLESAAVAIRMETLFYRLPDELQQKEKVAEKGTDATKDKPKGPRTADYQLPAAFVEEWQYKIVPPIGFQAKPLPPNSSVSLGPAQLTEEFATESDGTVRVLLRFDTVKRRLTVAEANELKDKVAQLREGQAIVIYFETTTQALMNQGKLREAFHASRDLIARHPKEAVHHLQRAKALLTAGMGQAARDEAQRGVKLEPNSALTQKTLAEILEYDLVGRKLRPGSDYIGAEAAFRAAAKLDPDDKATVANLAILLEHNRWGLRYGPGAKLKDAVVEYRRLTAESLAELGLKNNLAFALFYAGEFTEARKNAEALNPQPIALIVACEAAVNGSQAGLAEARKRAAGEEQFKDLAKAAGQMLENLRKYLPAADLQEAGASGSNASDAAANAITLRKTQLHERIVLLEDPTGTAIRYYLLEVNPDLTPDQVRSISSRNGQLALALPEVVERLVKEERGTFSSKARTGLFADAGIDLSVTRAQPKLEGNDAIGYKITLWSSATYKTAIYVVKEGGKYCVLGTSRFPVGIGLEVLDRLTSDDLAGARVLLDWLRDDWHLAGGDDPLSGAAFPRFWTKGRNADAAAMKLAAAAILTESKETAAQGLSVLERAKDSASNEAEKTNIALSLVTGYNNLDRYDMALAVCADLAQQYPESRRVFLSQSFDLRALGRFEEADRLAEDRLRRISGDVDAMRALVWSATTREDYPKAHSLDQRILAEGKAESQDLNTIAWLSLFAGKVEDSDIEDALKASQLSRNNASILHTLGCVYAEIGKTKEAREVLVQAMDSLNLDEPDDNYWYAFGRIAEQYGEMEAATADYKQVKKPTKPIQVPDSSYRLAQNRLVAMHGLR
jgi:transglutaminase-like putative cysteine protease/tetratricopeptide (TPR) repeat protein